jgi:Tol biopolymer transport system component
VSVSANGASFGNGQSLWSSISGDGRYVAFTSAATNLGPFSPGGYQIYLRDVVAGTTSLVSLTTSNQPMVGSATLVQISGDGHHVCFATTAALDPSDTNGQFDVYVRDLDTQTTRRVSPQTSGNSDACAISSDGRIISFMTDAQLQPADSNSTTDIYVRDMQTGLLSLVSSDANGKAAGADGSYGLSGNGTRAVFATTTSIDAHDTNGNYDVYIRDLVAGTSTWLPRPPAYMYSTTPTLSADGNVVAFSSTPPGGPNHVWAYDLVAGLLTIQSVDAAGNPGNSDSVDPALSADGLHVAFSSYATNFAPNDTNNNTDIFAGSRR